MRLHRLIDFGHPVVAFPPAASPASTEDYVTLKVGESLAILISVDNGNSVTGAAVTLKQATAVAGTSEKALAFTTYYANTDISANDTLTETTATSNTFTTDTTNAKNLLYVIMIDASDLDTENDFDCVRVDVTGNANCVLSGMYVISRMRYQGRYPSVSAITD